MFRDQGTEAREREWPALGQAELRWDQLVANPKFLPELCIWNNSSNIKLMCSNVYHILGAMLKSHWIFPNTIIIPSLQMGNWGSQMFRCLDVSLCWINKWLLAGSCYFPSVLTDTNLTKPLHFRLNCCTRFLRNLSHCLQLWSLQVDSPHLGQS